MRSKKGFEAFSTLFYIIVVVFSLILFAITLNINEDPDTMIEIVKLESDGAFLFNNLMRLDMSYQGANMQVSDALLVYLDGEEQIINEIKSVITTNIQKVYGTDSCWEIRYESVDNGEISTGCKRNADKVIELLNIYAPSKKEIIKYDFFVRK